MKTTAYFSLVAALLLLAQSGCTSSEPYRVKEPIEMVPVTPTSAVTLGYVEVDDQGELQSFDQLRAVTDQIKAQSRKRPFHLILFVHGWNHNASAQSGNVQSFKQTLESLALTQGRVGAERVFGVYIGWRGRTLDAITPTGDFYHRFQGGQRVGTGAGTDAIFEIAAAARAANSKNKIILVGHSFGALVLEHAISQPVRARLAEKHSTGQRTLDSRDLIPADLVLLINQAQPAVKARTLVSALRDRQIWTAREDLPWIVSITSQTDRATGVAFPAGVRAGRLFPISLFNTSVSGAYRDSGFPPEAGTQKQAARSTAGHFTPLHSHQMTRISDEVADAVTLGGKPVSPTSEAQLWHILANQKPLGADHLMKVRTEKGVYQIARQTDPSPFNRTPYWILSVPKEIIGGHNDIWSPRVTGLVTALMNLRTSSSVQNAQPAPRPTPEFSAEPQVLLKLNTLGF